MRGREVRPLSSSFTVSPGARTAGGGCGASCGNDIGWWRSISPGTAALLRRQTRSPIRSGAPGISSSTRFERSGWSDSRWSVTPWAVGSRSDWHWRIRNVSGAFSWRARPLAWRERGNARPDAPPTRRSPACSNARTYRRSSGSGSGCLSSPRSRGCPKPCAPIFVANASPAPRRGSPRACGRSAPEVSPGSAAGFASSPSR
jgi:hypothetical protein